jgi:hypothetical protein
LSHSGSEVISVPERIVIDHPLWDHLCELDQIATERFPSRVDPGLGVLGLILSSPPRPGGHFCTPQNSLAFAWTGGDGVHFSFLVQDGRITEQSPIVITCPSAIDVHNLIGGESLLDFLCLGYHRGYFALQTAPCERFFEAYAADHWPLTEDLDRHPDWDYAEGYFVNEQQRPVLDFLIQELNLSPWCDLQARFQCLQERYLPLLEVPDHPW